MDPEIQVFSEINVTTDLEIYVVFYTLLVFFISSLIISLIYYFYLQQISYSESGSENIILAEKSSKMGDEILDPYCDPNNPVNVTVDKVREARAKLGDSIILTPCTKSALGRYTNTELYVKKEFLQYTGSFKERGARCCMLNIPDGKKANGVIAASAGNHALGVSYHGLQLGLNVTVVMPTTAPLMKVAKCKQLKANVVQIGTALAEAKAHAMKTAEEKNMVYINGYDHPDVLAGAGTIGLEILEQVPDVEAIIIPVGGGGLIAGVSAAVKGTKPDCKIIGAESENCPGMTKALEAGKVVTTQCGQSLADGLAVAKVGYNSFETVKRHLDKMVVVKEEMIAMAILSLVELEKSVVEGAGACSVAALLSGVLPELQGKKVVCILSGGNIDSSVLGRVMERGLAVLGRLLKFSVIVKDRAGGISELLQKLTDIGVSVKDIIHDRAWVMNDVFSVEITVICETRGIDHALEMKKVLDESYSTVDYSYFPNACTARIIGI